MMHFFSYILGAVKLFERSVACYTESIFCFRREYGTLVPCVHFVSGPLCWALWVIQNSCPPNPSLCFTRREFKKTKCFWWDITIIKNMCGFMCLQVLSRWSKVLMFVDSKIAINYLILKMKTLDIQWYLVKSLSL